MSFKTIIQHCRALLSHHSFARNGFAFDPLKADSKRRSGFPIKTQILDTDQGRLVDSNLDLSKAVVVPDEEILENYLEEHQV
jgi:hypothetical protein